jgi:Na+/H+ antiporter NhaA
MKEVLKGFFNSERSGGVVLISATMVSLLVSNLFSEYIELWKWIWV